MRGFIICAEYSKNCKLSKIIVLGIDFLILESIVMSAVPPKSLESIIIPRYEPPMQATYPKEKIFQDK